MKQKLIFSFVLLCMACGATCAQAGSTSSGANMPSPDAGNSTNVIKVTVHGASPTEADPNYFTVDCGETSAEITVQTEDPDASVFYSSVEGKSFTVNVERAGIYIVDYTVRAGDGSEETHTAVLESQFVLGKITGQMFDNVLYVNNNPATNGGYEFKSYRWYRNGVLQGSGQYFSAGPDRDDTLGDIAEYSVTLTTVDGITLHTCPGDVKYQTPSVTVCPNPVRSGEAIILQSPAPKGSPVRIYSLNGRLAGAHVFAGDRSEIPMPHVAGIYLVTTGSQTVKVIVE